MPQLQTSTISLRELGQEAVAGLLQRLGRSTLTALGTVLGVGAFVSVLGITASANGQISRRFNVLTATEVVIEQAEIAVEGRELGLAFPDDTEGRIATLRGQKSSGLLWRLPDATVSGLPPGTGSGEPDQNEVNVIAASAGLWPTVHPSVSSGRTFDAFHDSRKERVAVVGAGAAKRMGITQLQAQPAVFIDGIPFVVMGILTDVDRQPEVLLAVTIPARTALELWGSPSEPARLLIETELGAAQLIGRQAPLALRPDAPESFKAIVPPDPRSLRDNVTGDLGALFLLLAGICVIIGTVGIANTTLVAVLERVSEIGLRRAVGARPRHVALQFLIESTTLGSLGGLIGTSAGVITVVAVALSRDWTAVLEPWTVFAAPLIGAVTGLLAGSYPAIRASRIEPVEALRR